MNFLICTDITGFIGEQNVAQFEGADAIAVTGAVPMFNGGKGVL